MTGAKRLHNGAKVVMIADFFIADTWFGVTSRVCISPHKFIALLLSVLLGLVDGHGSDLLSF